MFYPLEEKATVSHFSLEGWIWPTSLHSCSDSELSRALYCISSSGIGSLEGALQCSVLWKVTFNVIFFILDSRDGTLLLFPKERYPRGHIITFICQKATLEDTLLSTGKRIYCVTFGGKSNFVTYCPVKGHLISWFGASEQHIFFKRSEHPESPASLTLVFSANLSLLTPHKRAWVLWPAQHVKNTRNQSDVHSKRALGAFNTPFQPNCT